MRLADWIVFPGVLAYVALAGLWRGRSSNTVNRYLLGGREIPWYVVGLSIMATQASAVTFISTTGQAYVDGMRFVQFYFGLPIAMIILSFTAVPLFRKARVYTAYEFLEQRFDSRVRALVSGIFLLQRGLALGITLYAPAVVLTVILGWSDWITTLVMGGLAVLYTTMGGAKAIAGSDAMQMIVMTLGLVAALLSAVLLLPHHVTFSGATALAHAMGRLNVITTNFSWDDRYNLWSGLIGGAFLALAYFGTDQSQVQRYLTARSIAESRRGLLFNAAAKIPMQMMVLFIGAMVFVFYIYEKPPILFQRTELARVQAPALAGAYAPIEERYDRAFEARRAAADGLLQAETAGSADAARVADLERADQEMNTARGDAASLAVRAGGSGFERHELHLPDVRHPAPARRAGRPRARGGLRRDDDGYLGGDERPRDRQRRRHLQAPYPSARDRRALPQCVEADDVLLGRLRGGGRAVRQRDRVADRSRERARVAVLRRDAGRLRARVLLHARHRPRGLPRRPLRRSGHLRLLVFHEHRVPLVQRHRLRGRGRLRRRVLVAKIRPPSRVGGPVNLPNGRARHGRVSRLWARRGRADRP